MIDGGPGRVTVSGGEMSFVDVGPPEAPPVVLLHGFPTSSFIWRSFLASFATEMRVIAPDLLGAGASDARPEGPLDAEAQAAYVRDLLTSLDVSTFAVVGHGDGGTIAQLLAVGDDVPAVVLIDSAGPEASPAAAIERALGRTGSDPVSYVGEVLSRGSARPERISQDVAAEYARPFVRPGGDRALLRWAAAAGAYPSVLGDRIAELDVPTFLLWGEEDPFVPPDVADALNDRIATSSLALLPGCGHFLPEEAAPTIVPLVAQWLSGRYLGKAHSHAHGPVPVRLETGRSEADG